MRVAVKPSVGSTTPVILALVLSYFLGATVAQAATPPKDLERFKGLRAVELRVDVYEGIDSATEQKAARLLDRMALRLRMAGLVVLDKTDGEPTTGMLRLELDRAKLLELYCDRMTVVLSEIELRQNALLERDKSFVFPVTWRTSDYTVVPLPQYDDTLSTQTDALVDKFLNEWLKWNPKRR